MGKDLLTAQVVEITEQVKKENEQAKNNASSQFKNSVIYDGFGVKNGLLETSKSEKLFKDFEKKNAVALAEKFVSKFNYQYSFEEAQEKTKNFTLYLTPNNSEDATLFGSVGDKNFYSKPNKNDSVTSVLHSFDSYACYYYESNKQAKEKLNAQKNEQKTKQKSIDNVIEQGDDGIAQVLALRFHITIEEAKMMLQSKDESLSKEQEQAQEQSAEQAQEQSTESDK